MRKIKVKKKKQNVHNKNIKETFFTPRVKIFIIVVAVLVIIFGVIIYIEDTDDKIVIKNNTDLKLEYVQAYYVGPEDHLNEGINVSDIEAGKTISLPQEPMNLLAAEANLEVRFKFENQKELFVDAGIFNDNFNGKVTISFDPTGDDDKVKLRVKAKSGVITSKLIECDDTYIINFKEGYVED